jgi:hypothetical protein
MQEFSSIYSQNIWSLWFWYSVFRLAQRFLRVFSVRWEFAAQNLLSTSFPFRSVRNLNLPIKQPCETRGWDRFEEGSAKKCYSAFCAALRRMNFTFELAGAGGVCI